MVMAEVISEIAHLIVCLAIIAVSERYPKLRPFADFLLEIA